MIMDEPTAVLAPQEIVTLFQTLRSLVADGKSVVFISHKLNEVMEIADRISVLRKGAMTAAGVLPTETTIPELAQRMVGREVLFQLERKPREPGDIVLSVENLEAENDRGLPALRGVSLNVRAGEIVGLAGVAGNGQSELAEVITGLRPATGGTVSIDGRTVVDGGRRRRTGEETPRKIIDAGVSHIPEDRTHVGTAPNLSVADNLIMKGYRRPPIGHRWSVQRREAVRLAEELRDAYEIIVPGIDTPARLLSGGNLQRLILAREISSRPRLMIAMQPTRGLDVGAIEGVQRLLLEQREAGAAILLVSEELEELRSLSDRIYVISNGSLMGEVREADETTLGLMMTGHSLEEAVSEAGGTS